MNEIPCVYRISVKAIIKDEKERIMLIREHGKGWELPGGGLEHGEDPRSGLKREVKEEIGCVVEWMSDQPAGFWTIKSIKRSVSIKWFAFVAYEARITGPPSGGEEADEVNYFTLEEIRKLPLHENTEPYFLEI